MKHLLATVVCAAGLALAGCASSGLSFQPSRLSRVNLGMTKEQVLHVLGQPRLAGTSADALEVFRYAEPVRACSSTNHYAVVFKAGQVIDYGLETGVRLGGQLAIPELFNDAWQPKPQP